MSECRIGKRRQSEIYGFIVGYIIEHQYPPSVREIRDGVGLSSTGTVNKYMEDLRKQGRIDYLDKQPRTIRVRGYKFVKEEHPE